ncbi:MAG: LL-diaminopimelate aminotransferase [Candidatus Caenarcaniphilales bacterium]|nr:LL-diaminopimelate aminotransferase [Candidatus Caenarcaniphilales bacterium]
MTTNTKPSFFARRLDHIPPYLFAEIDKRRQAAIVRGVDIVNLGIGDPDQPTPHHIVEEMHQAIDDPRNHNYPPYAGTAEYRKACVSWFSKRFNIPEFDPNTECVSTIGSKEAIHNMFLATIDPGDIALIADPGYPVYRTSTILCGGTPYTMPLLEENDFLIDLDAIPEDIARKAKIMFFNYPNNPTGAFADLNFFQKLVDFARKYDILLCHDHAYSEIAFDDQYPISIFNVPGAKEVAIEFFSLSKGYNMTGWRVGFCIGNEQAIKALSTVKTNIDSGVFKAIQRAAIYALTSEQGHRKYMCDLYQKRAKVVEDGLKSLGWEIKHPCKGTLYIWQRIPRKYQSSIEFASDMLDKAGIVVPPGIGYGQAGEGFFRIALSADESRIQEAIDRMRKFDLVY